MRKTGLIILTFIYLAFTAGVSVQRHFCMNRMAEIRFSSHPEDRCSVCGMEKTERDNSCCREEQSVYKITDDQQPEYTGQLKVPVYQYLKYDADLLCVTRLPYVTTLTIPFDHGPPGGDPVRLFIQNKVFRI